MLVIGYLGLIAGLGCLGLLQASRIKRRPKELREVINAMALLDTEIVWGITPLPEAFGILKERSEEPWNQFFAELEKQLLKGENMRTAWLDTTKKLRSRFCLSEDDWKVIMDISKGLGRSDKAEQHKQLALAQKHLEAIKESAGEDAEKKAKMWSYLGFLSGAALVILII
ncbi:Sporulation stage III protein AB [Syntrophobotulus glycolicus DSM 8271]|uniref:Sporulation stage III protein AB n=1 Tax=Syntrophobotulus glycolicus (strain DSM 8271 / FlGlyR) TaxID=645991 RepID=F0T0S3_SYNGF|nr:stage III sporulation protein AB [Syntrophobotulus glycolicus]ADY56212.1 Sporulation stage III protein AB [Syntrophobotulus glycolicus DSM 8271]